MENKKDILSDLIHLVSLGDNVYLLRELEKIQDLIKNESNDLLLGAKLRKIL